jgi:hypothetical protein
MSDLLPRHALKGVAIGLSTSHSDDLARLGLLGSHFELALRELARVVLIGGGTLSYGGNLDPGGYTWVLVNELRRYACEGGGLRSVLHWYEHRRRSVATLKDIRNQLGVQGELICLARDRAEKLPLTEWSIGRGADADRSEVAKLDLAHSLTVMREYLTLNNTGRLVIGGKRFDYSGPMPGLLQEALLSLRAKQPLYLAAGFGGITLDMAAAVDADTRKLLPAHPADRALDAGSSAALDALRRLVADTGWVRLNNGLSDDENRRLAATHRPAEIAALVSLGLGRVAAARVTREQGANAAA